MDEINMTDPWIKSLALTLVSGIILGFFKIKIGESFQSAKDFISLQFKNLDDRIEKSETKLEALSSEIHTLNTKLAVVISEQANIKDRLEISSDRIGVDS